MKPKIYYLENFKKVLKSLKKRGKKIVLCHGVFDILHLGHIKHFNYAKKFGEILVVGLTQDKFINKGLGRPIFNVNLRAEMLSSISTIDYIIINNNQSATDIIKLIKPNFYCKGIEYKDKKNDLTKKISLEISALKKNKGKIIFSEEKTFSSSKIINDNLNIYSKNQSDFINKLKKRINNNDLIDAFNKIKKIKTIVFGEIILDHYIFSETIGKSAKDAMLVIKEADSKLFVGGSGSIAKNVSNLTNNKVKIISYIGQKREHEKMINKYLGRNIKSFFLNKKNSSSIIKKRYIDKINNVKLLGIYNINDTKILTQEENLIKKEIIKDSKKYDLTIVNDFGHGLITKNILNTLKKRSNFITVNSQINSTNFGYHSMKYLTNIDCLSINERELRHEYRDVKSDIKIMIKKISTDQKIKNVLVTRGAAGVILYNKKNNKFYECDAFAEMIVDKVGAGDTMHGVFSLCLKSGINFDLSLLITSLAAAKNLKGFANESLINSDHILKQISHMLK